MLTSNTVYDWCVRRNWRVFYYETKEGLCPIREFIDSRKKRDQAKILSWTSLLEDQGANLPRPYADFLIDGIHELRVQLSGDQIRILYFFCFKEFIILTHAFAKHKGSVAQSEISKSQKFRADFLARFDEQKLKEAIDDEL